MNEDANDDSIAKLNAIIEKEKLDHGLIGFHFDIGLTSGASVGEIAKEIIEMHEAYLAGKFVDITDQVL